MPPIWVELSLPFRPQFIDFPESSFTKFVAVEHGVSNPVNSVSIWCENQRIIGVFQSGIIITFQDRIQKFFIVMFVHPIIDFIDDCV